MENCARKWCPFFCTNLFEVTWPFWKMCYQSEHSDLLCLTFQCNALSKKTHSDISKRLSLGLKLKGQSWLYHKSRLLKCSILLKWCHEGRFWRKAKVYYTLTNVVIQKTNNDVWSWLRFCCHHFACIKNWSQSHMTFKSDIKVNQK